MPGPQIFLSHITEEKELALILKAHLLNVFRGGVSVFVSSDETSIPAGARWLDTVDEALKGAQMMIVLCSRASVRQPWVNFEFGAGWFKGVPVVPVCHTGLSARELPSPLNELEGVEANTPRGVHKLHQKVSDLLNRRRPPPERRAEELVARVRDFEAAYEQVVYGQAAHERLRPGLFDALQALSARPSPQLPRAKDRAHGVRWTRDKWESAPWVKGRIKRAGQIRLLCYSFINHKNDYEAELKDFLRAGGVLRVLMLQPHGPGFYEKTALEGFEADDAFGDWVSKAESTVRNHENDLRNGMTYLEAWQREFGEERVRFGLYSDTPIFNGFLFDDEAFLLSSYFINPRQRGFRNPAMLVDDAQSHYNLQMLQRIFLNWFEVKLAQAPR